MPQFRKKPVVIEAIKWNGATIGLTNGGNPITAQVDEFDPALPPERLEYPDWMVSCRVVTSPEDTAGVEPGTIVRFGDELYIGTLEGSMRADPGDWIIRGVKGEIYPCKPDIFDQTYERV